jgi:glutamate racemase
MKILIIGTKGTIGSGIYGNKIKKISREIKVRSKPCPLFVPLVEEGWANNQIIEDVARKYLKDFTKNNNSRINYLVLACTHYPLLEKTLKKVLGRKVKIISSAKEVVKKICFTVELMGKDRYYFSDWTDNYQQLAEKIMKRKIKVKIINLLK